MVALLSRGGSCPHPPRYKMVCFDEIYAYSIKMLHKVKRYIEAHPEIIFSVTGDPKQLPPIGEKNSTQYVADCISQMFKKRIMLNIIKRCKLHRTGYEWLRTTRIF